MEVMQTRADQRQVETERKSNASVSLICTVRNEAKTIRALIESLFQQTRQPDEIIIADAASTDDTRAIIHEYIDQGRPVKLVDGRGNISTGRNKAIDSAVCDIIVSADAGLTLGDDWVERLVAPIERGEYDVTGGGSEPITRSLFEAVSCAMLYAQPHRVAAKVRAGVWHWPTRNGLAFHRQAWREVGGFPEHLDHNEDVVFAAQLQRSGKRFLFVPDAMVYFRPRSSLKALYRQLYLYSRGGGMAGTKNKLYALRVVAALLSVALPVALARRTRAPHVLMGFGLPLVGWLAYQRSRLRSVFVGRPLHEQLLGLLLIPLLRATIEYARVIGGTVGRVERYRRRLR